MSTIMYSIFQLVCNLQQFIMESVMINYYERKKWDSLFRIIYENIYIYVVWT